MTTNRVRKSIGADIYVLGWSVRVCEVSDSNWRLSRIAGVNAKDVVAFTERDGTVAWQSRAEARLETSVHLFHKLTFLAQKTFHLN